MNNSAYQHPQVKAIFTLLLGPGDREFSRFQDLVTSLRHFESDLLASSALLIVNDGNTAFFASRAPLESLFREVVVIDNPFIAKDGGILAYDRGAAGMLAAFRSIASMCDYDFVLKLDTDVLAAGKFGEKISRFFIDHPSAGMIGTLSHNPDGTLRDEDWWARWLRGTCGLLPLNLIRLRCKHPIPFMLRGEWRNWRRRRAIYIKARRSGWVCGRSVLGGAYAVSRKAVEAMYKTPGLLLNTDPFIFFGTRIAEDVAISMIVQALGFELLQFNMPGQSFGVWYQRPPLSLSAIKAAGFGLIHSIKDEDPHAEAEFRAKYFEEFGIRPRE